MIEGEGLSP